MEYTFSTFSVVQKKTRKRDKLSHWFTKQIFISCSYYMRASHWLCFSWTLPGFMFLIWNPDWKSNCPLGYMRLVVEGQGTREPGGTMPSQLKHPVWWGNAVLSPSLWPKHIIWPNLKSTRQKLTYPLQNKLQVG